MKLTRAIRVTMSVYVFFYMIPNIIGQALVPYINE